MKFKDQFDRLFFDCQIPSMMFLDRRFEELTVPNYPFPHPAFKGKDPTGTRFIYCRRPMRVTHNDGSQVEGVYPMVIFQRRYDPKVGVLLVFDLTEKGKFVTQISEDVREHLPDLTNAMIGDPVVVTTSGAVAYLNPSPEADAEDEEDDELPQAQAA